MYYSQSGQLAFAFQTAADAETTSNMINMPIVSESIEDKFTPLYNNNLSGGLHQSVLYNGPHEISGEVVTEPSLTTLYYMFSAATKPYSGHLNKISSNYSYGFVYNKDTTDFSDNLALHPFTLGIRRGGGVTDVYYDMQATTLQMELAHGQMLTATMGVVGRRSSTSNNSPKLTDNQHAALPWNSFQLHVNSHEVAYVRQLSLKIDNQLTALHTISGGNYPYYIKRSGNIKVSVEGSIIYHNRDLLNYYSNNSACNFTLVSTNQDGNLSLNIPNMVLTEYSPHLEGQGLIEADFNATATTPLGSSQPLFRADLTSTKTDASSIV